MYENGFQDIGGAGQAKTGYRYVTVGNLKIVELQVALHLMTDPGTSVTSLKAITLPDSVAPIDAGNIHALNDQYTMGVEDNRIRIDLLSGHNWWTGTGSYYIMHIMYTTGK